MKTATLKNWSVVKSPSTPYDAPECIGTRLQGEVYNHPAFEDGVFITSTELTSMQEGVGTTCNTMYKLGFPAQDYAAWCIFNGHNVWHPPLGCHPETKPS
ncbi:MAG TPA: hypothetical protein EYN67_15020 [Flavobacteriales bacterium]|nr:hypothetical protein [Flavobacteriales bacterium]HIB83370.1 hypothetical protein [Chromatiaceae bacterium]